MTYDQFARLILLDYAVGDPTLVGEMRFDAGKFRLVDALGVYDPRTVWAGPHLQVPNLAHLVDSWVGAAKACKSDTSPFPLYRNWYYDQAGTKLAATEAYTRDPTTQQVTQVVTTTYDTDGATVLAVCTDNITYSGLTENTRTRTIR